MANYWVKWRKENKMRVKEYNKEYIKLNKDKIKQKQKEWYDNNSDKLKKYRIKQRKLKRNEEIELRKKIYKLLGNKCKCCEVTDWWNLTLDHKKPIYMNRTPLRLKQLKTIYENIHNKEYSLLCWGCNLSKGVSLKCTLPH